MFDNSGYFCCENGQVGYDLRNTDGCSLSGVPLPADANPLAVINQVFPSISTSSSAAPTSPSPTTASPKAYPTTNATPGGTIAGAVVGGVTGIAITLGLLWFFTQRKKSSSATASGSPQSMLDGHGSKDGGSQYTECYAMPTVGASEIGGTPQAELSSVMERREMP
ncbi:hypothetical protein F4679DRAFT_586306 [Xylaria curta]|nr:hypothetical protein F4679DRAFT_586306 [Xylaria curta]